MALAGSALAASSFQPSQSVQVREGDTWSAATILKKEGRRYLVHYANSDASTDEWVTTDRMRQTESPTPATAAESAPETAPQDEPAPATPAPMRHARSHDQTKHEMFPAPDDLIAQTEPDRSAVDDATAAEPSTEWRVKPDPSTKPSEPRTYTLRSRGSGRELWIKQLLPCAGGGAVIGFSDFDEKARLVQRVGAISSAARAVLPAQSLPLAASPDGSLLICRCNAFGFGNNARIDAFHLNNSTAAISPFVSFTPYPSDDPDGKGEDVRFAAALSNTRIVTCDETGRLTAWDIKPNAVVGVWRVNLGRMRYGGFGSRLLLSPGGKWLAGIGKNGITFVDSTSGKILGVIGCNGERFSSFACSPTGSTILATGDGSLTGFDIAAGKLTRTVALPDRMVGQMTCPADGFALFRGDQLIDANTGTLVTTFKPPLSGMLIAETGQGVTLIAAAEKMVTAHIPDAATHAVAAVDSNALALQPGMSVAVDINVDMSDADKTAVDAAIREKLTTDGFVIDPSADTKVICRTEPGAAHEHYFAKTQMGMPVFMGAGGTSVIANNKVTRCTIQQGGKTIWERKRDSGPANSFKLNDGQSLEDGARATIKYDPQFLIGLEIPPYIAKPQ